MPGKRRRKTQPKKKKTVKQEAAPNPVQTDVETGASVDKSLAPPQLRTDATEPRFVVTSATALDAACATADWRWLFLGGADGTIFKLNFYESLNTRSELERGWVLAASRETVLATTHEKLLKGCVVESVWPPSPDERGRASGQVTALACHSEGIWALSGHSHGLVQLWTAREQDGVRHAHWSDQQDRIVGIEIVNNETAFVSMSWDSTLVYGDLNTGQTTVTRDTVHDGIAPGRLSAVVSTAAQGRVLTTNVNGHVCMYDVNGAAIQLAKQFHCKDMEWALCGSLDVGGNLLTVGTRESKLCEWDLRQEKGPVRVLQLRKQCGPVTAVTHVHDQLAVSVAGMIRLYKHSTPWTGRNVLYSALLGEVGAASRLLSSDDGRFLVGTTGSGGWFKKSGVYAAHSYDLTAFHGLELSPHAVLDTVETVQTPVVDTQPQSSPAAFFEETSQQFQPAYDVDANEAQLPILDSFTGQENFAAPAWVDQD